MEQQRLRNVGVFWFLLIATLFSSCSIWEERYTDADIQRYYKRQNQEVKVGYYKAKGRKMRYMEVGSDSLPTVLLIHGAPSSMSVFNRLITESGILNHARIFAVDRPGYGFSDFGNAEVSIKRQAAMIVPILDSIAQSTGPVVVLGVSYGGPVAARIAMDFPHLVDGLVLGAPAIAPGEEKVFTISHLMLFKETSWLFPTPLRVATEEKFTHRKELEKMVSKWETLTQPIIYIQGEDDEVVYTSNAQFIEKKAKKAKFLKILMIPNQPHFLAIPQKDVLAKSIYDMIRIVQNENFIVDYEEYLRSDPENEVIYLGN
jgi:pimeloyl-ACP methyl ester carboxylesterase